MKIPDLIKDPYERQARVIPGLLTALPILIPLVCVYGPKHPILVSVVALLAGCGATFALANVARGLGKKLEVKLVKNWGGMPTTIALRHSDNFLDSISKREYHSTISSKLAIKMPTIEEEIANPHQADDAYIGATKKLRELTRSNKQLLLKENIAYGFHRNMLAMKPVGIITSIAGLVYGLLIAKVVSVKHPYWTPINLADPGLAAGLTLFTSLSLLAAWLLYFNKDSVKQIGFVYAERLFECLSSLPASAIKKRKPVAETPELNK